MTKITEFMQYQFKPCQLPNNDNNDFIGMAANRLD